MSTKLESVIITAPKTNSGKTTVAASISAMLTGMGKRVRPIKCAVDLRDLHVLSCSAGVSAASISSFLVGESRVLSSYALNTADADVAVIESDSSFILNRHPVECAAGIIAKRFRTPIITVFNAANGIDSMRQFLRGAERSPFYPLLQGIVLNNANERRYRAIGEILSKITKIPLIGHIPPNSRWHIDEVYVPTTPPESDRFVKAVTAKMTEEAMKTIDTTRLLRIVESSSAPRLPLPKIARCKQKPTIAVARDFAFAPPYFTDNLKILELLGARIVQFSPLTDKRLPKGTDGVYIGGLFPEFYADELSTNIEMMNDLRSCPARGIPIYAEGGGVKYLARSYTDRGGKIYPLVGTIDAEIRTSEQSGITGMVDVRATRRSPLLSRGGTCRGYRILYCDIDYGREELPFRLRTRRMGLTLKDGCADDMLFATTANLHFLTNTALPREFVKKCIRHLRKMVQ